MTRHSRPLAAISALALFIASPALAADETAQFNQTMTCNQHGTSPCGAGERPLPVQWHQQEVKYQVNKRGSAALHPGNLEASDELMEAIWASFDVWNDVECSSFEMTYGGNTDYDEVGYDPDTTSGADPNILLWHDSLWPHPGYGAVALTTVTFRYSSGQILSADIEFNTADYPYTLDPQAEPGAIDFQNALTHEVGHFLGLDHSTVPESTMYPTAEPGETIKRQLHQVDIDGICSIYPLDATYPLRNSDSDRGTETAKSGLCGTTGSSSNTPNIALILIGLALFKCRRRLRPSA